MTTLSEESAIVARYERRKLQGSDDRNDLALPARHLAHQEKERAYLRLMRNWPLQQRRQMRVLEIGCGYGDNLQQFIRWGFHPENLVGNELLADRCAVAAEQLPRSVAMYPGDARRLDLAPASFDVVLQSTVFTSILDNEFQQELAQHMWSLVAPGGGVFWYDFAYDNPRNPDVRGVRLARIRELFPEGQLCWQRITLAPPLARVVTRVHPALYGLLNTIPWLRTHLLCWIRKPRQESARLAA